MYTMDHFLSLGFVIDFISVPVIAGFTSAAAITIASGQIKGLLGINVDYSMFYIYSLYRT